MMEAAKPEFYGRVMSINMLSFSAMPLMAFPLGRVADAVGVTNMFITQGLIVVGIMLVISVLNPRHTFGRVVPAHQVAHGARPGVPLGAGERVDDPLPTGGK